MRKPAKIVLDTSAATLARSSGESSQQASQGTAGPPQSQAQPQTAASPHSRWSPPTSTTSPDSPMTRLRRSISVVVSPVAATFHRRTGSVLRRNVSQQHHHHHNRESLAQRPQSFMMTETNIATPLLSAHPKLGPLERFRDAGQRVIQMNRLRRAMLVEDMEPTLRRPSILPALVPAQASGPSTIDVVDYGIAHHRSKRLGPHDFASFLEEEKHRMVAKHVRWIDVSGASWETANILAQLYDLHPLAVEDMFTGGRLARSKVDYYPQHIFIRLLAHLPQHPLTHGDTHRLGASDLHALKALASAAFFKVPLLGADPHKAAVERPSSEDTERWISHLTQEERARAADEALLEVLRGGRRVPVHKRHIYVFLRRDGTVITFHPPSTSGAIFDPIKRRLERSKSVLRLKPDTSLLVHSVLDQVIESAIGLIDSLRTLSLEFEEAILRNPTKTSTMRDLHVFSADIRMALATIGPMRKIVFTLRHNDVRKCIAMAEDQSYVRRNKDKVQGFITAETKAYLTDVDDQLEFILSSLDAFSGKSDRLLKYAFEMTSNGTARSTKTYTILVVSANPMIILAMYYGMNFQGMWSTQAHTEAFFWTTACPLLIAITAFIFWQTHLWKLFRLRSKFA